eukprot:Selendium_serpulae@DN5685_c0_g1_i1.p1
MPVQNKRKRQDASALLARECQNEEINNSDGIEMVEDVEKVEKVDIKGRNKGNFVETRKVISKRKKEGETKATADMLNPLLGGFTFEAKIIMKGRIVEFTYGEKIKGCLFRSTIEDTKGQVLGLISFNESAKKWHQILKAGVNYTFSKVEIKKNKKGLFKYDLNLNEDSEAIVTPNSERVNKLISVDEVDKKELHQVFACRAKFTEFRSLFSENKESYSIYCVFADETGEATAMMYEEAGLQLFGMGALIFSKKNDDEQENIAQDTMERWYILHGYKRLNTLDSTKLVNVISCLTPDE